MSNNFIGLRDPHLNVFYSYGDKAHLENNITKAFVNVLESFDDKKIKKVISSLFDFELPNGQITTHFYLQKKPEEELVKQYPNRIMFAFSPTGKSWGINGLDTKNEEEIRESLLAIAKNQNYEEGEQVEFVESTLSEIMKIRENKGSIPDGWLFVDIDNSPTLVVAMENKLYDLDPYQLNNHIEKSLFLNKEKTKPVYRRYEDIITVFEKMNSFLCDQFIEYMVILNYAEINDFSLACLADEKIRTRLLMKFGKDILDTVSQGEKDFRDNKTCRCHVNYSYLHEINLKFEDNCIQLWLSFGSTQSSACRMFSVIDDINISDPSFHSSQGFHLQRGGGKGAPNINDSYILGEWSLDKYLNYWKSNINSVRTSSITETFDLLNKLYSQGDVKKDYLDKIVSRLSRYNKEKTKIYIVPEISLVFDWSYEEAAKLGIEKMGKSIKAKLDLSLEEMKLKI